MKTEIVHTLTHTFEAHAQQAENGIEFWLARDLQHLLGYDEWRNFTAVIIKAKTACELSGHPVSDHFVDVNKMVDLGSGSQRPVDDLMLKNIPTTEYQSVLRPCRVGKTQRCAPGLAAAYQDFIVCNG